MSLKFLKKKLIRLGNSSNILKFWYYYHSLLNDKKLGNIGFNFSSKKTRIQIVQDIIYKKKSRKYLEIGCFDDELFNQINCEKKIGVPSNIKIAKADKIKNNNKIGEKKNIIIKSKILLSI